jgi:hypothetical protein
VNIALAKSLVATFLLITSTSGVFFILTVMGKIPYRGDKSGFALYHRILGWVSIFLIVALAAVCIYFMAPGAPPLLRIGVHKPLGGLTLFLALGKIVAARTDRHYLPLVGRPLYVLVSLSWLTSAGWYFYVMYLI